MIDVFEPSGYAWHFILNEYSWICSPTFDSKISHTTGNALSTYTPSLGVTSFTKPYRDVLGAHGFHCFRSSSSLHVSFISRVLLVLPTSLYYSLNLNCTSVNVCWLRFKRKHAGIPSRQTRQSVDLVHTSASCQTTSTLSTSPMRTYAMMMISVDSTHQYLATSPYHTLSLLKVVVDISHW